LRHGRRYCWRGACTMEELHRGEQEVSARRWQGRRARQDQRHACHKRQAEHEALQDRDVVQQRGLDRDTRTASPARSCKAAKSHAKRSYTCWRRQCSAARSARPRLTALWQWRFKPRERDHGRGFELLHRFEGSVEAVVVELLERVPFLLEHVADAGEPGSGFDVAHNRRVASRAASAKPPPRAARSTRRAAVHEALA
jgi:hypothetical protein